MIGGILLLAIVIFGIQVLFGKGKLENYFKLLIWLIFAPVLLAIGYNHALWLWYGLPLWAQVLSVLLLPFFVSMLLKLMFPKAAWIQSLTNLIFETLIYAVTFPFRFLWRSGRFILGQERLNQQLNPHRPVVGTRPPLENQRRENRQERNLFD